jgi:ABC-type amino acid transport substrate-binding protein/Na+/H+-dicarboxylate symporter
MTNIKLVLLAIILAVPFAYFVEIPVSDATFNETGHFAVLGLRIFGLFFAGISLIYSLFWLEQRQVFRYVRRIFFLVIMFELLSILISYVAVNLMSFQIVDFQVHTMDLVSIDKRDFLGLLSPLAFFRKPEFVWFFICYILGISLSKLFSNRFQINAVLTVVLSALKQAFRVIEIIAPIPIFFIIVTMVKSTDFTFSYEMVLYLLIYCVAAFSFIFYVMPILWGVRVKANTTDFYRMMFYPSLFAFGFGDVATALPIFFYLSTQVVSQQNEQERVQAAGVIIPFAYILFPIANTLMMSIPLMVLHITGQVSQVYEHLNFMIVSVFALASPNVAGAGVLAFLFDTLKLPQDATAVYIDVFSFIKHIHAFINSFSIGFILLYILAEKESWKQFSFRKTFRRILGYTALLGVFCVAIFMLLPIVTLLIEGDQLKAMKDLSITNRVESLIETIGSSPQSKKIRSLQNIIDSKVLRIGFRKNTTPFAYENVQGEIVGFDIELAHLLAADLDCKLELVSLDYSRVVEQILNGYYDIAMSGISVTVERIKKINFTDPVIIAEKVLIAKDYRRNDFEDPDDVIADTTFRIAFLEGSSFEEAAKVMFPKAKYVPLKIFEEFMVPNIADALLWTRQEGYHWVLRHPAFSIVSLSDYPPPTREVFAFGLSYEATNLVEFLNQWLLLKESNQVIDDLRNKWKIPTSLPSTYTDHD